MVLVLMGSLLSLAGSELLSAQLGDSCEDHCDDSCEACGDCIQCLPTLHMITIDSSARVPLYHASWLLPSQSIDLDGNLAEDIDHPPQNFS